MTDLLRIGRGRVLHLVERQRRSIIKAIPIAGGTPRVVATSSQPVAAGPAVDACNVYWGVTPDTATCGLCPPPPMGQINAVMRAPKSGP